MKWQQWVLLTWYLTRVPFIINSEVKKPRIDKEMKSGDRERSIVIGILVSLSIAAALIVLVVTI